MHHSQPRPVCTAEILLMHPIVHIPISLPAVAFFVVLWWVIRKLEGRGGGEGAPDRATADSHDREADN